MTKQMTQKEFKRVETKYLVPGQHLEALLADLSAHLIEDDFARSTITSLYFDTADFAMIQDSLAKKHGKEKVRLRTYAQQPTATSPAFLEIKQKIDGVGYKYRVATTAGGSVELVAGSDGQCAEDSRMAAQLAILAERYGRISPKMLIAYKRLSFKGADNPAIRVTLDTDLTYAEVNQLELASSATSPLLPQDQVVMEIKVADQIPTWLQAILTTYDLEKASFSKYGRAYQLHQENQLKEEVRYA